MENDKKVASNGMENGTKSSWTASAWEAVKFIIVTLFIVIPIRAYVAQPFIVSGASMYPTFADREYLIVDELSYRFRAPERGEVIVFRYPNNPKVYYIKRIIGLPGETVTIKNNQIFVQTKDGQPQPVSLPGIDNEANPAPDSQFTLGPDQYYVLGDNRLVSSDSRFWGPLPGDLITGRALIRLFPINKIGLLPGNAATSSIN